MATYVVFCKSPGHGVVSERSIVASEAEDIDVHRLHDSMWLIDTRMSPSQVVDHLQSRVGGSDMLWVSELTSVRSYNQAFGGTGDWLARHLPAR